MVETDIDHNPLDPNYEKRRSSLGNMEHKQQDQSNVKREDLMLDKDIAPSSVSPQPAHQHTPERPRRSSSQDVDHSSFLSDISTDRGLQEHPEQLEE